MRVGDDTKNGDTYRCLIDCHIERQKTDERKIGSQPERLADPRGHAT